MIQAGLLNFVQDELFFNLGVLGELPASKSCLAINFLIFGCVRFELYFGLIGLLNVV